MLVPHRRDDAELGEGRGPADQRDEACVFVGLQAMRDGERLVDLGFRGAQRLRLSLKLGNEARPIALSGDESKPQRDKQDRHGMIAMTEAALLVLYRATYSSWPGLSRPST